jgi:hypothetical protein
MESNVRQETGKALLLAQYAALRAEIAQRILIQHQIIAYTLTIAGAFLAVSVQLGLAAPALLIYPVLAAFLASGWAHNDGRIHSLGKFIKSNIERPFLSALIPGDGLEPAISDEEAERRIAPWGWEHKFQTSLKGAGLANRSDVRTDKALGDRLLTHWFARPVFLLTELLAIVLAYRHLTWHPEEIMLLVLDGLAFIWTIYVVAYREG